MAELRRFFNTHKPKSTRGNIELALELTPQATDGIALDLCCGTGRLTALAAEQGLHAYGVDLSDHFIGTEGNAAAGYVVGEMERVPFAPGTASVVYCIDSLQYARDPEAALAEMNRLLKPGGVLIFSTQNTYNPAGIKKWLLERLTRRTWSPWLAHPIEHAIRYPRLMRLLQRQGFEVEYVRGRQHLIAWVSLLPEGLRKWSPWRDKDWRSLQKLTQRVPVPAAVEESALARFGMLVLVRVRKVSGSDRVRHI
jgi:SAM-dependent methyltransferase